MQTRKSQQRKVILETVTKTDKHPIADWVHEQAKKKIPNLSLGTTYRNLRVLTGEGMISELTEFGKPSRYDGITEHHSHFQCEKCREIININGTGNSNIADDVSREIGATISNQVMSFRGVCQKCQKRRGVRKARVKNG